MKFLTILFICTAYALNSHALELPKLNSQEWNLIESGKIVAKKIEKKNKVWPENYLNLLINASPLEAIAFYCAYEIQHTYLKTTISSKVIKHISPTDVHVLYTIKLPWPLGDGTYVTGNKIEKLAHNTYKVSWYQVESTETEETYGYAIFHPYKGKTLLEYRGFAEPRSILGGVLKDISHKKIIESIEIIKSETEKIKKQNLEQLNKYISLIINALDGKMVYKELIKSWK